MPATPASYIKGNVTDNFIVEKSTCRISAEFMKWRAEIIREKFSVFLLQNSDNPSYATVVPAVHLFSNMYLTPCLPPAGFESINAGNDGGGSSDL